MSLHEQNKAKIKAGTFVEVLSLEHLALISKYMVELGFYFYIESFDRAKDGTQPFLHFHDDFQVASGVDADEEFKEVKIEMPEETTANEIGEYLKQIGEDIHARILAEKVGSKHSHYFKDVSDLDEVDVYRVCDLFEVNDPSGAKQHAIKKLLCSGQRGAKDERKDLEEARDAIVRKLEMMSEDNQ